MGKFFNNEQPQQKRAASRGKTIITKKIFGSFTHCTSVDTRLERQKYRERTPSTKKTTPKSTPSTKKTIPTQGKFFSKSSGRENKPILQGVVENNTGSIYTRDSERLEIPFLKTPIQNKSPKTIRVGIESESSSPSDKNIHQTKKPSSNTSANRQ